MQILNRTLTKHAMERSMERSIPPEQIKQVLQGGIAYRMEHGKTLYQSKGIAVVCDKRNIVTVMHREPKLNKELWQLFLPALPLYVPYKPINPLFGACYREWEQAIREVYPKDFQDTGNCVPGAVLLFEDESILSVTEDTLPDPALGQKVVVAYKGV